MRHQWEGDSLPYSFIPEVLRASECNLPHLVSLDPTLTLIDTLKTTKAISMKPDKLFIRFHTNGGQKCGPLVQYNILKITSSCIVCSANGFEKTPRKTNKQMKHLKIYSTQIKTDVKGFETYNVKTL